MVIEIAARLRYGSMQILADESSLMCARVQTATCISNGHRRHCLIGYRHNREALERSLKRGRFVQILYVYQDPGMAWEFVKAREELDGRRILPEHFIEQYFAARKVVNQLKEDFDKDIVVTLLLKNLDGSDKVYKANVDKIDNHIPEKYSEKDLSELISAAAE